MAGFEFEGRYDAEKNISYVRFIGKPTSNSDVDYLVEKITPHYMGNGKNKIWQITDITEMGMAAPNLVIYYNNRVKELTKKYVQDYVVISSNTMQKLATNLFNTFLGEKHDIVQSIEEAEKVILERQEKIGRFPPL
ncbi:MAG TPA: hypothetical protein PKV16_07325 [Caldisericia bacterium]|nr:hypothetical protein [Caldisericia bacterium]HPF49406.1 hypothetical protein [Caldisericia bacterium]HPI84391.1 hypothetical protein [Caldisericia bacterium]HPQ93577.1 hypothetical protein [Caldisericia bacterium]HRV75546.1 hypothetical protein [Caldisericia bacterium]